jgi:FkbM family methyltransferase
MLAIGAVAGLLVVQAIKSAVGSGPFRFSRALAPEVVNAGVMRGRMILPAAGAAASKASSERRLAAAGGGAAEALPKWALASQSKPLNAREPPPAAAPGSRTPRRSTPKGDDAASGGAPAAPAAPAAPKGPVQPPSGSRRLSPVAAGALAERGDFRDPPPLPVATLPKRKEEDLPVICEGTERFPEVPEDFE